MVKQYKTKQRSLIEDVLKNSHGEHLTVDMIAEKLNESGNNVGITTIYRCLERLVGENKVHKFSAQAGQSACYSIISDELCHEHFHLKCTSCGRLIHIDCGHFEELTEHIKKAHSFKIDNFKSVLYGVCEDCSAV